MSVQERADSIKFIIIQTNDKTREENKKENNILLIIKQNKQEEGKNKFKIKMP